MTKRFRMEVPGGVALAALLLLVSLLIARGAAAAGFSFDDTISVEAAPAIAIAGGTEPVQPVRRRFGQQNSGRFNVLGGAASDFDGTQFAQAGIGVSWFALDWFSLECELLAMGAFQDEGKDAVGGDLNVMFRWHFWHTSDEAISVYAELGIGFAMFSEEVPEGGSNFNFAPQVGVGASFDLGDDLRLLTGVRWLHLSNARTTDTNEGIDSVLLYAGLSWGF